MVSAEQYRKWESRIVDGDLEGVLSDLAKASPQMTELGKARFKCKQEALSKLSRLKFLEAEKRKGVLDYEGFSTQMAQLREQTLELLHAMESKDITILGGLAEPTLLVRQSDTMDKAFKGLLLGVFGISFFLIVRAVAFSAAEFDERLFQLSVSSLGCGGGLFGYFRWRVVEIKSQPPNS